MKEDRDTGDLEGSGGKAEAARVIKLNPDGSVALEYAGRLLSRLNGREQVNYVVEGKLLTDISMLKKIPFQETGTVSLKVLRQ